MWAPEEVKGPPLHCSGGGPKGLETGSGRGNRGSVGFTRQIAMDGARKAQRRVCAWQCWRWELSCMGEWWVMPSQEAVSRQVWGGAGFELGHVQCVAAVGGLGTARTRN